MDKTLLKGLEGLERLVEAGRPLGVTAFAGLCGLTKSNAHRILRTFAAAGFLRQNPETREYAPSLKLWELGSRTVADLDLRAQAADVMRWLADETRETVHLSVLDGGEVVYLDKIDSPEPVRAYSRIGGRAPAYCVATGKAQLAYADPATLEAVLGQLERHTPNTIVDPAALQAELADVRAVGFAVNRGEWRDSVWGIADVVRARSAIVGAIGISGPSFRLDDAERIARFAALVHEAARRISRQLG